MVRIFIFFWMSLSLFWIQKANALCDKIPIEVKITMEPTSVIYNHSLSRKDFPRTANKPLSPNTLGLTVSRVRVEADTRASSVGSQSSVYSGIPINSQRSCVGLNQIHFKIVLDTLQVYIDKKYPIGSCQYNVIKDHEDYHVAVYQEAMTFFKPDIEKALKTAVDKLRPEYVYSKTRANQVFQKQIKQVLTEIQPVLDHINKKIREKNEAIDTPESYATETKKCPSW